MRGEAEKRIGHLDPKVEVTAEMAKARPDLKPYVGRKLTVIAWLWARTVKCPNPACGGEMPLLSSCVLSEMVLYNRYYESFDTFRMACEQFFRNPQQYQAELH